MRFWLCTKLFLALCLVAVALIPRLAAAQSCGSYNPTFYICCNGVLSPKGSNDACCGTQPYSTTFSICCNGVLSPKGSNNACCGTQPYNTTFYRCCPGGFVVPVNSSC
ncbi:MAG TPA: hypothetical protein VGS07_16120 [Thermoanaerobaculia bacterium]|jgi:hypothetical protein|nr:hypothetical protein [Thermoanaerobaculia bacterium]